MSSALSVGIVSHFPPSPGGMPEQAETLARGFEHEGYRVVRIASNLGGSAPARALDAVRGLRTLLRVPVFLVRLIAALPAAGSLHVLSCSGLSFFLFTAPAVLLGALAGRRVGLHYHGGDAKAFFRRWPRTVRFVVRRASAVFVPSAFLRDVFAELGVAASIVPNVCDGSRFLVREHPSAPRFVVARHLEPVYNTATILHAFERVLRERPDAELWILGDGSERRALERLAADLGISKSCQFFGYIANARIPDIFAQVSYFVNASVIDNQPMSILEAYAAGLPVITSPAGGIPDIVEDRRTGLFFDPRDPSELASKMLLLLRQPDIAQDLAARGRQKAEDFSWPAAFRVLGPVYGRGRPAGAPMREVAR